MVQQCDDAGLPRPFWKSDPKLGVTVTFTSPEVIPQTGGKSVASRSEVTPEGVNGEAKRFPHLYRQALDKLDHLDGDQLPVGHRSSGQPMVHLFQGDPVLG